MVWRCILFLTKSDNQFVEMIRSPSQLAQNYCYNSNLQPSYWPLWLFMQCSALPLGCGTLSLQQETVICNAIMNARKLPQNLSEVHPALQRMYSESLYANCRIYQIDFSYWAVNLRRNLDIKERKALYFAHRDVICSRKISYFLRGLSVLSNT